MIEEREVKTSEIFSKQIGFIHNTDLQNIVKEVLDRSPKCIQKIPASSSRKYHPAYACETGGLVKHIKAAVGIAISLMRSDIFKDMTIPDLLKDDVDVYNRYSDVVIAALIMHDCKKPDDSPQHRTVFSHPILAAELFESVVMEYITPNNKKYMYAVTPLIYNCIAAHMGKWNINRHNHNDNPLPTPKTGLEQFVHLCDYLASRKFLEYNFENEEV